ncbi:MAG: hypothetical protein CME06_03460, partial [Gemmatimonadetes bacterium]|nr:hypothetical protein [Gemmatimonadota bacterium]
MERCKGVAVLAQIALLVEGCGLESPELPTWQASYVVPILSETWDAAELFAELDTAFVQTEGDSSSLGIDLRLDLDPVPLADALSIGELEDTIRVGLDEIEIDVSFGDSASFYPFWALYSELDSGDDPYFGIVPMFEFDHFTSVDGPVGYDWVDLESGSIFVEITNGLPVPILDPTGSPEPRLVLESETGEPIAEQLIDVVLAPAEIRSIEIDVEGERLEATMRGRLIGSSAGSDSIVDIDPNAFVSVRIADGEALVPEAFAGEPGPSEGVVESSYAVESDFEIESAKIASGQLDLTLVNRFPLGFEVALTIPTYRRDGAALAAGALVGAGESVSISLDLDGVEIVPQGAGGELVVHTALVTEDRSGRPVTVDPDDEIRVDVAQLEIGLATVTGRMTAPFEIEADTVETGLGDASLGLRFVEPAGTVTIDSLPAELRNLDLAIVAPGGYPVLHLAGTIPAAGGDVELDPDELEAFLAEAPGTA